jgi:biotin-(acetyl-CoA carboxylase) ligase
MKMNERNHLVIGIGINLENCPNLLSQETTCLINEKIIYRDIGQVLNLFMHYFDKHYAYWSKRGFLKIRRLWLSKAINLNQVVTVDNGVDRISGVFKDIDLNGNMRLQISSGQICSFGAGDVFFTKEEDILG